MTVLYFGSARDCAGQAEETIEVPEGLTVGALWSLLIERHPKLEAIRSATRVAVEMRYASDADPIHNGAEVAIIPPVAGG